MIIRLQKIISKFYYRDKGVLAIIATVQYSSDPAEIIEALLESFGFKYMFQKVDLTNGIDTRKVKKTDTSTDKVELTKVEKKKLLRKYQQKVNKAIERTTEDTLKEE